MAHSVLELELQMTARLNQLLRLSREEGDGGSEAFLFPLIANQVIECEDMPGSYTAVARALASASAFLVLASSCSL